jgi:hypothetical protein
LVPKFLFSRKVKPYYKTKIMQGFFRQAFW